MAEKVLVILIISLAVIGLVWHIRKQQSRKCDGACPDCPLRNQCDRETKTKT